MKKILISHAKTIQYNEDEVHINNTKIDNVEEKNTKDLAYELARSYYKSNLSNHFENFVILTGSGTSFEVGDIGKKGKLMSGLWDSVKQRLKEKRLKEICKLVKYPYPKTKEYGDLEALLTKANIAKEFIDDDIEEVITEIQNNIKHDCTLTLPDNSMHELFLKKITSRKLKYPRVKLFTLNYDTLFEQAAGKCGYTIIDGFSYSFPRTFNGKYFDYDIVVRENSRIKNEENYATRVFHLYKPHGSIDWEKSEGKVIKNETTDNPVMIYPKSTKFESSYEQPFFEMIAKFQQTLRKENIFLITIGFSFSDRHISSIIHEALDINPSFNLMVITLGIETNDLLRNLREKAMKNNNIILVEEKFFDFVENYPFNEIYHSKDGESNEREPVRS